MIYNIIRYIGGVILFPFLIYKYKFIWKRLFSYKNLDSMECIWFHMASVGEVNLSYELIMRVAKTGENILITVVTDTGMKVANDKYKDIGNIKIIYFPLDSKFFIKKIITRINIKLLIIVETEIWPNLINQVSKDAEIIMVNGRISDKSYESYKKIRFLIKGTLKKIDTFFMQTQKDQDRIIELGAPENKTEVTGNLKFNVNLPEKNKDELEKIKQKYNIEKEIFVAGSTHSGEEEFILENLYLKNFFLFLVPRHVTRIDSIERYLKKNNYDYVKWSQEKFSEKSPNIVLVDEMGVLTKLYQIADLVFVGGSLVDVGGHNLLEPLYYKKEPIFGPYMQNAREIANEILDRDIGYQIDGKIDFDNIINRYLEIKENGKDKNGLSKKDIISKKEKKIDDFFNQNKNGLKQIENTIKKIVK